MKSTTIAAALLAAAMALPVLAQTTSTPRIDQRQANQQQRIDQGVQSGALTEKEAARMEKGQERVQNMENKAAAYNCSETSRTRSAVAAPTIVAIRSKLMFSSWSPISALVAGVKIGDGSLCALRIPAGRRTPQTSPPAWYSFQPLPAR